MTVYIIRGETVSAYTSAPARIAEGELLVASAEQIETGSFSIAEMVAIWNAMPGCKPIKKFKDRKTAAQRLWAGFERLPVEPGAVGSGKGPRQDSKQVRVIGLLRRPEGVTIDEMATAMGWQRHTVRGLISGALKKKLGLEVVSEQTDRGRLYRIADSRPAAE